MLGPSLRMTKNERTPPTHLGYKDKITNTNKINFFFESDLINYI